MPIMLHCGLHLQQWNCSPTSYSGVKYNAYKWYRSCEARQCIIYLFFPSWNSEGELIWNPQPISL